MKSQNIDNESKFRYLREASIKNFASSIDYQQLNHLLIELGHSAVGQEIRGRIHDGKLKLILIDLECIRSLKNFAHKRRQQQLKHLRQLDALLDDLPNQIVKPDGRKKWMFINVPVGENLDAVIVKHEGDMEIEKDFKHRCLIK